jgi:hypothetical protein
MQSVRFLPLWFVGALVLAPACGGPEHGVVQTPNAAGGANHGQCLDRGVACKSSGDCCSQWCVSGTCSTKQP